jgi:transcription antitermination factor NusG
MKIIADDGPFHKGDIVTITKVDEDDDNLPYRVENESDESWVHRDCIESIMEMEFKVGDKVRILSQQYEFMDSIGKTATIESIGMKDAKPIRVDFGDDYWNYSKDEIELVKEDDKALEFKVGDKVKIVTNDRSFRKGAIVTIIKVDEGDNDWPYKAKGEYNTEWVREDDITAIKNTLEFKVGDKVKIVASDDGYFDKGYIATITMVDDVNETNLPYEVNGHWVREDDIAAITTPEFTKDSLKTGMLAKTKEGDWYVVILGVEGEDEDKLISMETGRYMRVSSYSADLKNSHDSAYNIVAVATVGYLGDIFRNFGKDNVTNIAGFKVIWEESNPRIAELKKIIADAQKELGELHGE